MVVQPGLYSTKNTWIKSLGELVSIVIREKMYIAIDPGLTQVGYAIFKNGKPYFAGVIIAEKPRLEHIFNQLYDLFVFIQPEFCILERTFVRHGSKSSLDLAGARGVIKLVCQLHNVPIDEVTPNQARKAVLNRGNATKEEVIEFVKETLSLKKVNHNLADAILLGYINVMKNCYKPPII
jgi:crossover junction endodeoxyribonuclease RuvC